ncbi:hypothetical protein ANO11243_088950 [Dothideomycetidae sp. 11243]|nr:hypothetical protein ANO11243_088950 [fungal sp. No.11243]
MAKPKPAFPNALCLHIGFLTIRGITFLVPPLQQLHADKIDSPRTVLLCAAHVLQIIPLVMFWAGLYKMYVRPPAPMWVLLGTFLGVVLWYIMYFWRFTSWIDSIIHFVCIVMFKVEERIMPSQADRVAAKRQTELETAEVARDSKTKTAVKTTPIGSREEEEDVYFTAGATFLPIILLVWISAGIVVRVDKWAADHQAPEEHLSFRAFDDLHWIAIWWLIMFGWTAVGYVWSTRALARDCIWAVASAVIFVVFALKDSDPSWQARIVDAALTFFVMQIGLGIGFLTGPA